MWVKSSIKTCTYLGLLTIERQYWLSAFRPRLSRESGKLISSCKAHWLHTTSLPTLVLAQSFSLSSEITSSTCNELIVFYSERWYTLVYFCSLLNVVGSRSKAANLRVSLTVSCGSKKSFCNTYIDSVKCHERYCLFYKRYPIETLSWLYAMLPSFSILAPCILPAMLFSSVVFPLPNNIIEWDIVYLDNLLFRLRNAQIFHLLKKKYKAWIPLPPMIATSCPPWISALTLRSRGTSLLTFLVSKCFLFNDSEKSFTTMDTDFSLSSIMNS